MKKNMFWEWATTLEVKDTYQNKVYKQSHYVWEMSWV